MNCANNQRRYFPLPYEPEGHKESEEMPRPPFLSAPGDAAPHVGVINDIALIKLPLRRGCDDCHDRRLDKSNSLASEKKKMPPNAPASKKRKKKRLQLLKWHEGLVSCCKR